MDASNIKAAQGPKTPAPELGGLWQSDIANRVAHHMKIDPIESEPMASGVFDPDGYLT